MENRILEDSQYRNTDADVVEKYGTQSGYGNSWRILILTVDLTCVTRCQSESTNSIHSRTKAMYKVYSIYRIQISRGKVRMSWYKVSLNRSHSN